MVGYQNFRGPRCLPGHPKCWYPTTALQGVTTQKYSSLYRREILKNLYHFCSKLYLYCSCTYHPLFQRIIASLFSCSPFLLSAYVRGHRPWKSVSVCSLFTWNFPLGTVKQIFFHVGVWEEIRFQKQLLDYGPNWKRRRRSERPWQRLLDG